MGLFSKEQIRQIIKENNIQTTEDIQSTLKELFADTLKERLEAELDTSLGYDKHDKGKIQTSNRLNGHSKKKVRSEYGESEIQIPRDREGEFDPLIVKKNQSNVTGIEDQMIAMYAKGLGTRDIQDHLKQIYGIEVSPTLISNVTNKIMP